MLNQIDIGKTDSKPETEQIVKELKTIVRSSEGKKKKLSMLKKTALPCHTCTFSIFG